MGIVPLAVIIIALTLVVLGIFLVPLILEIRKTAVALREFIDCTETELKPILRELNETLADLKVLTHGTAEKVEDVKSFMEAVGDTGRNLHTINTVIGSVAGVIGHSSIWLTGAKVAGRFIIDRIIKKRG